MAGKSKNDKNSKESQNTEDLKAIEEKVRRMMDPAQPETDSPPKKDSKSKASAEPAGAPLLDEEELKLPTKISIKSINNEEEGDNDSNIVKVKTKATKSSTEEPDETPVSEVSDDPSGLDNPETSNESEQVKSDSPANTEEDADSEVSSSQKEHFSDPDTEEAVEDIIRNESDKLLEAEDKTRSDKTQTLKPAKSPNRLKRFFGAWWRNKTARKATLGGVLVILAVALAVPTSRYFLLNTVGARSGASIFILDDSTRQPLKNARVTIRGNTQLTNEDGWVSFSGLKLGLTQLTIEKTAFAIVEKEIVLGWGSNPLGDSSLTPVGVQYSFRVTDYLSGEPIKKVEAISGNSSAFSDEEGLIKLTIDKTEDKPLEVSIEGSSLRSEDLQVNPDEKSIIEVQMVPNRRHAFITKRSGKFDLYKIHADGKNEELVLAGSGHERDDINLIPHPNKDQVALVSTRTGDRNTGGFLLNTLLVIDLEDNSKVEVAKSERIQLLGWDKDKLIFVRIVAGTSAANPQRHKLLSYDTNTFETAELASSNYFNDLIMVDGKIYVAPSSAYQTAQTVLSRINSDGGGREVIIDKEVWSLFRTSYHKLALSVGQDWYEYDVGSMQLKKLSGEPPNLRDRMYVASPNGKNSLWVDNRDGKGVLLAYNLETNEDKQIHETSGLRTPVRWLNDNVTVFRVNTDQETADYAVNINGGEPKKIRDVTNTSVIDNWFYY